MKKIIFAILVAALMLTAVSCKKDTDTSVPQGMFYEENEDKVDYKIFFPEGWIIDRNDGGMTRARVPETLVSNKATDKSNVSVTVFAPAEAMKVDDYINNEYRERMQITYPGYETVEDFSASAGVTLGGEEARRAVFKVTLGDEKYQVMQIITVYRGYVYLFTYTATEENYPFHEEDVLSIVENFKFV